MRRHGLGQHLTRPCRRTEHVRWSDGNTHDPETKLLLPGDDLDDSDPYDVVPAQGTTVSGCTVTGDSWIRAELIAVKITRTYITNADMSSARFTTVSWDRCHLRGCSLIGAHFDAGSMKNVIFENCRLDYAAFDQIRAIGPVAFLDCSMTETTLIRCQLTDAIFDGCKFSSTQLDAVDLRGADLRDNDLSGLTGISSLRGALLAREQLPSLTEAVVHDFGLTVRV